MKKFIMRANIIKNLFPTIFYKKTQRINIPAANMIKNTKNNLKMKKIEFDTKINKKRCAANIL